MIDYKAWQIRKENFPDKIEFVYPSISTAAVSVTGPKCSLNCMHCGGHYLQGMKTLDWANKNRDNGGIKSWLISGGCNAFGEVDYSRYTEQLGKIKMDKKINLHVGLSSKIDELSNLADCVSFDFIGDNDTIEEVLGISRPVEDYIHTFKKLREKVKVVPHICIGIRGGEISGEYRVLEILKELKIEDEIVFIVFIPTKGTGYAWKKAPQINETVNILAKARVMFPKNPIYLGCMRPRGSYRRELDCLAIECGVNRIVQPAKNAYHKAESMGLKIESREECCVF